MSDKDSDKDEAIIRRYYEELLSGGEMDAAAIDQYVVDGFAVHGLPLAQEGREAYKQYINMLATCFSERTGINVCDIISDGDKVVARWSWTGKHSAEFMGIPATQRRITLKGIDIFRLTGGKIADLWQEMDVMGILQQISAPPANPSL